MYFDYLSISSWSKDYRHTEKSLSKHQDTVINLKIVKELIDSTENNTTTRKCHLNGLANFLKYFDNNEFKKISQPIISPT